MDKAKVIKILMENSFLISPELISIIPENFDADDFIKKTKDVTKNGSVVLNKDLFLLLNSNEKVNGINWQEFEKSRVDVEKGRGNVVYNTFLDIMNYNLDENKKEILNEIYKEPAIEKSVSFESNNSESNNNKDNINKENNIKNENDKYNVVVLKSYKEGKKGNTVQDFVGYFKTRYETLKEILLQRTELQNAISISRLGKKNDGEQIAVIGLVLDKSETKNGNIILKLEDPSGVMNVIISKNKTELLEMVSNVVLDEVVGIIGFFKDKVIFVNTIFNPEIPTYHELKKCPDDVYAVFISDIHIGLKYFLADDFMNFIKWLRGEFGNENHREIASKVGYLFVTGDIADGVGIYPGQDKDLTIPDIYKQYEEVAKYFSLIPLRIKVIMCGGNHDAMRLAEPQPILDSKYAASLYKISNIIFVSNPATVNIHSSKNFPGFDVLMYHGYSFPYYADNISSIRSKGGIKKCDMIMKNLMQKRHLAPTHGSSLYIPDPIIDSLIVDKVPDIFVTGHLHQITVSRYKSVDLINSSCWCTQTEDMERRGIVPHPGKIPIINLKTREVKIMNFRSEEEK